LNCSPRPSLPKHIPTIRKSRRVGIPNRYPVLLMRMLEKIRIEPIISMFSAVKIMIM